MKKFIDWEMDFSQELDQFLCKFPCEVDEEMYNYFMDIVQPRYLDAGILQCGESSYEISGTYYYITFVEDDNKFWYLGILPEFKQ